MTRAGTIAAGISVGLVLAWGGLSPLGDRDKPAAATSSRTVVVADFDPLDALRSTANCTWGASSVSATLGKDGRYHESRVTTTGCSL